MKKKNLIIIVLLFLFSLRVQSQVQNSTPSIEVFGTAVVKVSPDIMNFALTINTKNINVLAAKNENDRSLNRVLDVLKDRGIPDKDIQTGGIRVFTNNSSIDDKPVKEYSVGNSVVFILRDIVKYYDITTELIKIDNVNITQSTYDYSNIVETRKHAREQAMKSAKLKAEELAAILNQSVGKPLMISEEQVYDGYPNPFNVSTQQNINYSSVYTLQEGTISVEAKVKLLFELINSP